MNAPSTVPSRAPIDFRIATSLPFSSTSMMPLAMMENAATRMPKHKSTNIRIFSILSAEKRLRLSCFQSCTS